MDGSNDFVTVFKLYMDKRLNFRVVFEDKRTLVDGGNTEPSIADRNSDIEVAWAGLMKRERRVVDSSDLGASRCQPRRDRCRFESGPQHRRLPQKQHHHRA